MHAFVTLSNAFVQHPQTTFSLTETRLFHAALRCLHQKMESVDAEHEYDVSLKDVISGGTYGYRELATAIVSLKQRTWFGHPLFTELEHVKREAVVVFKLNPALQEHLLPREGWFCAHNVEALEAKGLHNPVAWRLLWVLSSYYRPKSPVKQKTLTIAELSDLFYAGDNPHEVFSELKQFLTQGVKALDRAGVHVEAKSHKRGCVAKGITYTLPGSTLLTDRKNSAATHAGDAFMQVAAATPVKTVAVEAEAPIAADLTTLHQRFTEGRGIRGRGGVYHKSATCATPLPVSHNTYVVGKSQPAKGFVEGRDLPLPVRVENQRYKLLEAGLTTYQINRVLDYVKTDMENRGLLFVRTAVQIFAELKHGKKNPTTGIAIEIVSSARPGYTLNALKTRMGLPF